MVVVVDLLITNKSRTTDDHDDENDLREDKKARTRGRS
jgi:hypothetical protein